jgi:hypothetical protein
MDSAITPSVGSAVPIWSDGQNVEGSVATPEFPGPITTNHGAGPLEEYPGSPAGPPLGHSATVSYFEHYPSLENVPGELGDYSAIYGHAAPIAAFDSNAGNQHGQGPIAIEVHEFDTGGTYRTQHVPMPKAKGWWRRVLSGQTWNRTVNYDTTGKYVAEPNDRTDLDQYQGHNADAYDPYWIPYGERAVYLNIAHEPVAHGLDGQTAYTPQGQLGPTGPLYWTDQATLYEAPPDPATAQVQQSGTTAAVGFWG